MLRSRSPKPPPCPELPLGRALAAGELAQQILETAAATAGTAALRLPAGELAQEILEAEAGAAPTLRRRGLRVGAAKQLSEEVAEPTLAATLAGLRLRGACAADHHFEQIFGVEHLCILPVRACSVCEQASLNIGAAQ